MKKLLTLGLLSGVLAACTSGGGRENNAEKAPAENAGETGEWIQLFNGKDLEDWTVKISKHELNDNYANTFRVEDSVLKVSYEGYDDFNQQYGHMFYKQPFSAYLISVEYRFTGEQAPGGEGWAWRNSGVMLHGQSPESMKKDQDFPISIEAQLLGGDGVDERSNANLCTPGTNVEINGELYSDHCLSSSSQTYHGDRWVKAQMLVLADSIVKHIVEGDTVLAYEKPQIGGGSVNNFDPAVKEDGKLLSEGYISLQSESHPIEFRKVELFDLEPYLDDPTRLQEILNRLAAEQ